MLNRKTFQTLFAAAAFAALVFVGTDAAAAEANDTQDQIVMQQLAELINIYGDDQEDPNTLTLDAIDAQFNQVQSNLTASDPEDDC